MADAPRLRRTYLDWARGLAVLLMIEAHTVDAWTREASRHTRAFAYASILGGFAAPLFLWLAGVSLVLSASSVAAKTGSRALAVDRVCRRGIEIFILAFLFRLQAFVVSPGSHPVTLFRVDILNVMGPAVAASALVWGLRIARAPTVILYASIAASIAMVTPIVRTMGAVDALPTWLQWYVRPAGEHTTFTVFPWSGFVFAGAAAGLLIDAASDRLREPRLHIALAVAGVVMAAGGLYASTLPSIYRHSSFWTSSPTYFAIRIGIMTVALAAMFAWSRVMAGSLPALAWLERFGRSSLFVYWIHVELVYGYTTWIIRRRLPLGGWAIAYAIFCAAMYASIGWRDRIVSAWRARRRPVEPSPAVA